MIVVKPRENKWRTMEISNQIHQYWQQEQKKPLVSKFEDLAPDDINKIFNL